MGKYDRNKPYNNLPILPPSENKIIKINILKALNNANKALAELKGIARKLPNQSMLVNTISLTQLENLDPIFQNSLKSNNFNSLIVSGIGI